MWNKLAALKEKVAINETVTIYIDDKSIRLMVFQGQKVSKWAELQLEPGLVKGAVIVQNIEIAARIKQLLIDQDVKTKKVILGYSGLHSLTRPLALPQLPQAMLAEAVAREARRVLPMPLDQLYLSWRSLPCPKGKVEAFIVASPRKVSDSLVQALHASGLEPFRMAKPDQCLSNLSPQNASGHSVLCDKCLKECPAGNKARRARKTPVPKTKNQKK